MGSDQPTSSAWDRAFLLTIITIFSAGTLFGLGRLVPLKEPKHQAPILTDLEQAPDADIDGADPGDADGD
jgi:hypothetical protein